MGLGFLSGLVEWVRLSRVVLLRSVDVGAGGGVVGEGTGWAVVAEIGIRMVH